jgi:hypothetical protein
MHQEYRDMKPAPYSFATVVRRAVSNLSNLLSITIKLSGSWIGATLRLTRPLGWHYLGL